MTNWENLAKNLAGCLCERPSQGNGNPIIAIRLVEYYYWNRSHLPNWKANGPFPSYLVPLFQNESWCTTFIWKWNFLARSLSCKSNSFLYERLFNRIRLKQREKATRTWRIVLKTRCRMKTRYLFWRVSIFSPFNLISLSWLVNWLSTFSILKSRQNKRVISPWVLITSSNRLTYKWQTD